MKYRPYAMPAMVAVIIIPVLIVAIVGIASYLAYKLVFHDLYCKRAVSRTLQRYNIKESPSEIIREYYKSRGEKLSEKDVGMLEKNYRQREPEQFLTMYDAIRESNSKKD